MKKIFSAFMEGFATPWEGLRHMNRHPSLWRHAVFPILCTLALTAGLLALLAVFSGDFFAWLDARFPEGAGWTLLQWLAYAAAAIGMLGLLALAWIFFQGIFCGYFYSRLAREVEIQMGMNPSEIRELPLMHEIVDAALDVSVLAGVFLGCLVLGLLPFGAPFAAAIGLYFNCFVFGMDYLGYPQSLRALPRPAQRGFARAHRAQTLGLGASVMLISFVPLLNSVLLCTAAAGSVLLYRSLAEKQLVPPKFPAII